jgi:peptidoglycan/LPS O-acetylase OafA/YrhL
MTSDRSNLDIFPSYRQASSSRIPSLDGLRAASIILVLIGHGSYSMSSRRPWMEWVWSFCDNGHLGVTIFFVISGYLITHLLRREQEKNGFINLSAFYKRRMLRIFPAFYVFLTVIVALVAIGMIKISPADILLSGTYTLNYRALTSHWNPSALYDALDPKFWYVGHLWSLCLEEQFYLIWPVLLISSGLERARWIGLGIVCLEPVLRVGTHMLYPPWRGISVVWLPWAADPLIFGALAALWQGHPFFDATVARLRNGWVPVAATFFLVVLSPLLTQHLRGFYTLGLSPTLESLAILSVLFWLTRHSQSCVGRIFNLPIVTGLGVLSYSLYLWQQLFLVPWNEHLSVVQEFPWNFLSCFAFAVVSYFVVEKPFLRWKKQLSPLPLSPEGLASKSENVDPMELVVPDKKPSCKSL